MMGDKNNTASPDVCKKSPCSPFPNKFKVSRTSGTPMQVYRGREKRKVLRAEFVSGWQWFDIGQQDSNLAGDALIIATTIPLLLAETSSSDFLPDI